MSRRIKLAFLGIVLIAIVVIFWHPVQQATAVTALQKAAGPRGHVSVQFYPNALVDNKTVDEWFTFFTSKSPKLPSPRLLALCGSSVQIIEFNYPDTMRGEHAALFAHFPRLEGFGYRESRSPRAPEEEWQKFLAIASTQAGLQWIHVAGFEISDDALASLAKHPTLTAFSVNSGMTTPASMATFATMTKLHHLDFENYVTGTEADWIQVCAAVRKMTHLDSVTLGGEALTDTALAQLAGHPTLDRIIILGHKLTPACTSTFATLPRLRDLMLSTRVPPITDEERKAITTALPAVKIDFLNGSGTRLK